MPARIMPSSSATPTATRVTDFGDINRLESDTVNLLDFDGFSLHTDNQICYTKGDRNEITKFPLSIREKPPKEPAWEAFLFPYCEQDLTLRLVAICSLVKPFAKAMADYPRRDGEKERNYKIFHRLYYTPPSRVRMEEATIKVQHTPTQRGSA